MATPLVENRLERGRVFSAVNIDEPQANASAVSWGAILAGAAAAAALSLILLILGTGLGLSSASPWTHDGIGVRPIGISTILWVTLTQLLASGLGGYLAGRLRTRWLDAHSDEIYFRDTAHGFLAWAIASLATAALLTSAIGSIVNRGVQAGSSVAGDVTSAATVACGGAVAAGSYQKTKYDTSGPVSYFVDSLFRRDVNATSAALPGTSATSGGMSMQPAVGVQSEVARIFMNTVRTGELPQDDSRYVGQLVALRTGLSQQDAEKRVTDTYAHLQAKLTEAERTARDAVDKARKASAYAALWLFISLLIGAFVASWAATYGGRQRDA